MLNLIFWPKPYPNESPSSLFSRAAFHNGYSNARSFARSIGHNVYIGFNNLFNDQQLSNFFLKNNDNPYSEYDIFYFQSLQFKATHRINIAGMTVPSSACRFRAHFCPLCLQDGYWRFIQDIEFIKVCPYHQVEYLNSCPACGKKYDWSSVNGPYCRCHYDLRLAETVHSDDIGPLNFLNLFISGDQDATDRFFAAIDCLKYPLLTSKKIDNELILATNIAEKHKNYFHFYIATKIKNHPNLSPKTILSPWMLSRDQWIRDTANNFASTLRSTNQCDCSENNCCGAIAFTFNELCSVLQTNREITRSIITNHKFEKITISDRVFYKRNNICRSIKNSIEERTRVPIPETHLREEFESIEEIQLTHRLSATKIRKLIDAGYFHDGIIFGKRDSILISKDALDHFAQQYITENLLSRTYSLNIFTIRAILKQAGISASSGEPNIADLPYVYQRQNITDDIQRLLKIHASKPKHIRSLARGPTSAWHFADVLNIERRTLYTILDKNIIEELNSLYNAQTKTFAQPETAMNILVEWRDQYKTNVELAKHLNIDCNLLGRRFEHINATKPVIIGTQKFYHSIVSKEIERQLMLYVPACAVISQAHLSTYSFRSLIKNGFIVPIDSDNPAYCPKMSLYNLSDVLLQSETP